MKLRKRLLSILLAAIWCLALLPADALALEEGVSVRGTCGDNLTWILDSDGVLTVSGTGPMDTDTYGIPWIKWKTDIISVVIEPGVTSIGRYAFEGCTALTSVTIPDSVTSIGQDALKDTGYYNDDSNWTEDILYIGNWLVKAKSAFSGSLAIQGGTAGIADAAFDFCYSLTGVTLPDGLIVIGRDAFWNCSSLTEVTLPESLKSIGEYAFFGCTSLTSVAIPDSVTLIGGCPFAYCTSLTEISVHTGNSAYVSVDGVLFSKDKTELLQYPVGRTAPSYSVPDGVISIGTHAFYYCGSLTSVTIPDSVEDIGENAFSDCSALTCVSMGNGVKSIGARAFSDCTSPARIPRRSRTTTSTNT